MKKSYYSLWLLCIILSSNACQKDTSSAPETPNQKEIAPPPKPPVVATKKESILQQLTANYDLMPEKLVTVNQDSTVYAQYAKPTDRYRHGVLGDRIEAGQLVVVVDSVFYEHTLAEVYVYEDLRPRLYDVDGDKQLEFICIRSHASKGAGIVIYKLVDKKLIEYATVAEIGTANRWLNLVAINDLDDDGTVELAWIQTPHIGGILKVAKIEAGELSVLVQKSQYSNHASGSRNLCLSVLTKEKGRKIIYVPNQSRNQIVGFSFLADRLFEEGVIERDLDFSRSLHAQYNFEGVIDFTPNCINPQ